MDHPNIAKVLDAGATESGRPYFVMDLVRGVPITDFCDENDLTPRERLDLFVSVCQAVQHAHQKGIIHRDIKPSNVLVALDDAKPVIKVIDFGVAKAIGHDLTDKTLFTRFDEMVGTPLYMSPEQTAMRVRGIDTRSDIYSLGVLLYELLTGTTPFDKERLCSAVRDEVWRIIREEEPPKPSTRISALGDSASIVAEHRKTDPGKLTALVRGDLDWIVMKALEKERSRRYETAKDFADDVMRHVNDEPIEARPPSTAYRVRKFVRRNRALVASVASILLVLVLGIVSTTTLAIIARNERVRAEGEAKRAQEANEKLEKTLIQLQGSLGDLAQSVYEQAVAAILANDAEKARSLLEKVRQAAKDAEYDYDCEVHVLEGLIACNAGEYDRAVREGKMALSAASARNPDEQLPAWALLADASWGNGDSRGFLKGLQELRGLEPKSHIEYLLKAYAFHMYAPDDTVEILEHCPQATRSALGLYCRGAAYGYLGGNALDAAMIDKAIRDLECSQQLNTHDPRVFGWKLTALAIATTIARSEGRYGDADRYIERGRETLARAPVSDHPFCLGGQWGLLRVAGDTEAATRAIRRIGRFQSYDVFFLATDAFSRLDDKTAVAEFDRFVADEHKQNRSVRLARALLLGGLENRHEEIEAHVADLLDSDVPFESLYALYAYCLIAEPQEIHARARSVLNRISQDLEFYETPFGNTSSLSVLAGEDEDEWIAKVEDSAFAKAQTHFSIGMLRLAEKRSDLAHEQFKLAVDTDAIMTFGYEWAYAYKEHMESHREWPKWLNE
jgi:tetratricopeptide (TPR) repeat protein